MSRALQRPTPAQVAAADPAASPWVGANAGSGKTRVLTQRVARLLLAGAEPQKILCLTYTKAAAAEMQNRLFAMLGDWAMAPDDWLAGQLALIEGGSAPDPARLGTARRLFARALETPGGLRIQTIHAFCDSLLRRFPLEAGISPRFEVMEDRETALMLAALRTGMALEAERGLDPAFDRIARRLNEDDIDALLRAVLAARDGFGGGDIRDRLQAHFGADATLGREAVARAALAELDLPRLSELASELAERGGDKDKTCAKTLGTIAALAREDPLAAAENLSLAYLTGREAPRSRRGFPVKAVLEACPWADALTDDLIGWAVATRGRLKAVRAAERARDLDAFATRLLGRYEATKRARALLDFDDLVARAHGLLVGSDMAAWALWKLDHGIDHILVDEAQDTAPRQWALIEAIAAEFYAGHGARPGTRTLFVVGDEKQSIYSFQGAEPRAFGTTRERMAGWLEGVGSTLARPSLATSFRSAPGILRFVDAVFQGEAARGLTLEAEPVAHAAHRAGDAARIDLWPLVTPLEQADEPEWWQPIDRPPPDAPKERLATALAAEIERMIAEDRLPPRAGRPGRAVRAGDILVLVTRRDRLAHGLIRRLKTRGVAVAGADRLSLTAELAVKDLMALCKVALTPSDDLSLAALLRSPLCELSEQALFELAHGRPGTLWQALMDSGRHPAEAAMLDDLSRQVDFLRPYEFLERALILHDGRRRLLARLGLEAEDPIDELLAQALVFERREVPSMAGFVDWVEAGDIQIKREMEADVDAVRVMTVHGAKGLEAPVVILPDTMARGGGGRGPQLHRLGAEGNAPPLVLWARGKTLDDPVTATARAEAERRDEEERRRLLYVALTRAEDWLILCGAGDPARAPECWYGLMQRGMDRLDPVAHRTAPAGLPGTMLRYEDAVPEAGLPEAASAALPPARPAPPPWLAPAPREARAPRLSPSVLAPHEAMGGEGLGRALALLRGSAIHRLLEMLPDRPAAERADIAARLLAAEFPELAGTDADAALAEALAVLAAPFAARLFGPGSRGEVTVALPVPGGPPMIGRIDRLVLDGGEALVVDYKTDAAPPVSAAATPPAYLAQIAAYCRGVAGALPDHRVGAAILWTRSAGLARLPDGLLEQAASARPGAPPAA